MNKIVNKLEMKIQVPLFKRIIVCIFIFFRIDDVTGSNLLQVSESIPAGAMGGAGISTSLRGSPTAWFDAEGPR